MRRNNAQDWILAGLVIVHLIYVSVLDLEYNFGYRLIIHYSLYITGLVLAITHFVREGFGRDTGSLEQWAPKILFATLFVDMSDPLKSVPAFAALKVLFYFTMLIQFSHLVFGQGRPFRSGPGQAPPTILLIVTTIAYFNVSVLNLDDFDLANKSVMETVLSPEFLRVSMSFALAALVYIQFWRPTWLSRVNSISVLAALAATVLSTSLLVRNLDSILTISIVDDVSPRTGRLENEAVYSTPFLCLFLFVLALVFLKERLKLSVFGTSVDFTGIVSALFALDFLLLYTVINKRDIVEATVQIMKFQEVLGTPLSYVVVVLSVAASVVALIEFRRERPADS